MQPIAVITSPAAGILYINGRIAGETGPDAAITLPVTPNGTAYMQLFPFGRRYRPGAYRLSLQHGEISIDAADDTCRMIIWPGNIIEISLMPLTAVPAESEYSVIDGIPAAILRGDASLLRIGGHSVALPDGAGIPNNHTTLNGAELYTGKVGSSAYLSGFSSENLMPIGTIIADSISVAENRIMTETSLHDAADHLRTDIYEPDAESLNLTSTDIKSRRHPDSAENTAIAAIEAMLLGLADEVKEYLSPGAALPTADADGVIPMKYPAYENRPAIGLLQRINPFAARVTPLFYTAAKGSDGKWRIQQFQK